MATSVKSAGRLPYGLRDGRLLSANEVANGLACECLCPGCGARLVARNQGQYRTPHFAHYQAPECAHGLQTALHLAAKDIFLQHRTFCLPGADGIIGFHATGFDKAAYFAGFDFPAAEYQHYVEHHLDLDCEYLFPPRTVAVERVTLEHRTADIIPDIILETDAGPLLVEIAVTHFIDEAKQEKIKRLGISTVEIDLSKVGRSLAGDQLAELLIYQPERKRWAYNARLDEKVAARQAQYLDDARKLFNHRHSLFLAQIREEEQEKEREEKRRAERAALYVSQCKPITKRQLPNRGVEQHVLACPDPRYMHEGQTYANVETNCFRCPHYRGYHVRGASVVCLQEYNTRHRPKKS
jgi:hypothetical protein